MRGEEPEGLNWGVGAALVSSYFETSYNCTPDVRVDHSQFLEEIHDRTSVRPFADFIEHAMHITYNIVPSR